MFKMKCAIVYLIKGKAKSYHKRLTRKISRRFKINCVSDKIELHITLKYFNQDLNNRKRKQIEKVLEDFVKAHKKSKIKLKGIGHFGRKVIFIDALPSNFACRIRLKIF